MACCRLFGVSMHLSKHHYQHGTGTHGTGMHARYRHAGTGTRVSARYRQARKVRNTIHARKACTQGCLLVREGLRASLSGMRLGEDWEAAGTRSSQIRQS
jgi:hypothetical protein